MAVNLADVPTFSGARPATATFRTRPRDTPFSSWSRRTFIKSTLAAGTGIGLATLGLLPPARKALASHSGTEGYQIKTLPCPSEQISVYNPTCAEPCQPSDICASCCVTNPSFHKYGWHKAGADDANYDLRPNVCTNDSGHTGKDGWQWDMSSCCNCNNYTKWRCHDGEHWTGSDWNETICKWVLSSTCSNQCGQFCCD